MANRKFKLSEMLPNAWFFKLKEIGTKPVKKQAAPPPPHAPPQLGTTRYSDSGRKSYHFTRELDPPRKSGKKRRPVSGKRPSSASSSSLGEESCVEIAVDGKSLGRKTEQVPTVLRLPPIRTERSKFDGFGPGIDDPVKEKASSGEKNESLSVKVPREEKVPMKCSVLKEQGIRPVRRVQTGSPRFRVRINSPRIARRSQVNSSKGSVSRKSITSQSLAVVKSSFDPKRDFRDSMEEMIIENNIRTSNDLEELLACYLSLNSDEYHDLIIQVFKQIWFDLYNITRRVGEVVE